MKPEDAIPPARLIAYLQTLPDDARVFIDSTQTLGVVRRDIVYGEHFRFLAHDPEWYHTPDRTMEGQK